jgi:hypothetical protein
MNGFRASVVGLSTGMLLIGLTAGSDDAPPRRDILSPCHTAGLRLRQQLRVLRNLGSRRADDFSLVVFCQDLGGYQVNQDRDYGVVGEPIYVVLYDNDSIQTPRFEFPSCAIEEAGPRGFSSGALGALPVMKIDRESSFTLKPDPPFVRTCYNTAVEILLKGTKKGDPVELHFTLPQAQRYHFTTQLGVVFTQQHAHTFGLRPDDKGMNHVHDKGPFGRGPEYLAAVVLYSIPKQIVGLFGGKRYQGRDIVHDQGFADRLGGVLGVGLAQPGKRFVAGLSFELLNGISLVGMYSWARLPVLDGVRPSDTFNGTVEQIPTRDDWNRQFVWGVSLDLRYAAALINRSK